MASGHKQNALLRVLSRLPRTRVVRPRRAAYQSTVHAIAYTARILAEVPGMAERAPDQMVMDWIASIPLVAAWANSDAALRAPREWPTREARALMGSAVPYEVAPALAARHSSVAWGSWGTAVAMCYAHGVPLKMLEKAEPNPERVITDAIREWHAHDGFLVWKHNVAETALPLDHGSTKPLLQRMRRAAEIRRDPFGHASIPAPLEWHRRLRAGLLPEADDPRPWGGDVWVRPTIGYPDPDTEAEWAKMRSTASRRI